MGINTVQLDGQNLNVDDQSSVMLAIPIYSLH